MVIGLNKDKQYTVRMIVFAIVGLANFVMLAYFIERIDIRYLPCMILNLVIGIAMLMFMFDIYKKNRYKKDGG